MIPSQVIEEGQLALFIHSREPSDDKKYSMLLSPLSKNTMTIHNCIFVGRTIKQMDQRNL